MANAKGCYPKIALNGGAILDLPERSAYIYGTLEERSKQSAGTVSGVYCHFIFLKELGDSCIQIDDASGAIIDFKKPTDILLFVGGIMEQSIYIDITGLSHDIWAPLLRESLKTDKNIYGVYMEPSDYAVSQNPAGADIYDLSEKIDGIKPLPGFVNLGEYEDDEVPFVPLLGFEGARFAYVLEHIQPSPDRIFPVVGVPGFRLEYPFKTFQGNLSTLLNTKCWRNVRYAAASCPFEVYEIVSRIAREQEFVRVAPIGTKPHALGAMLFASINPSSVEVVYDHPKRKKSRSSGIGKRHVYGISCFLRTITAL